jgi:protein-S-isoprenylcysteine O-methyltransferase Ste14
MKDEWRERSGNRDHGQQGGALAVGVVLVVIGLAFLAFEQFNVDFGRYGWPVYVIAPGVVLLLIGLAIPHEGGLGAAIPGGIITTVGLLLAYQEAAGAYASWAYAWALVAPGSVGLTLTLYGLLHRRMDLLDAGLRTAAVGLGLFVGFGLFFENVIGLDEGGSTTAIRSALPMLAVGLGVIIVIRNLLPPRASRVAPDSWTQVETPSQPPMPPAI